MTDISVGATIVHHIDELEAALRYARNAMEPLLGHEVARIFAEKKKVFGWDGTVEPDLDGDLWLAPAEWQIAGDTDDNYNLFLSFDAADCMDQQKPLTWIATFAGFAGAGIRIGFHNNALAWGAWKGLLRSEAELVRALVAEGFLCDPKTGVLALIVPIDRAALADAFADGAFGEALTPIGATLDRIHSLRPLLDRLVEMIRARAA